MQSEEWRELFTKKVAEAEKQLADAMKVGFSLWEKTVHGEIDVTKRHIDNLRAAVDEYKQLLK
jgi:hypothetical protein